VALSRSSSRAWPRWRATRRSFPSRRCSAAAGTLPARPAHLSDLLFLSYMGVDDIVVKLPEGMRAETVPDVRKKDQEAFSFFLACAPEDAASSTSSGTSSSRRAISRTSTGRSRLSLTRSPPATRSSSSCRRPRNRVEGERGRARS